MIPHRLFAVLLVLLVATSIRCGSTGSVESTSSGSWTTSVSGRVATAEGQGIPGVSVSAWGTVPAGSPGCTGGGYWSGDAVTDAAGRYQISGSGSSSGSGTITITASLPASDPRYDSCVISPVSLSVPVSSGASVGDVNFTGYPVYTVSGTVRDAGGAPLPGTTVSLAGTDRTASTADNGAFVFRRVFSGTQTLTPVLPGYTFDPVLRVVAVQGADSGGNDFTGTYIPHRILGHVTAGGRPLPGTTLSASGPTSATTLSGSDGAYDFGILPRGAYTVSATMAGYRAMTRPATLDAADVVVDFDAIPLSNSVYGRVTGPTGAGLSGITVSATGPSAASTSTTLSGDFMLGPLTTGTYTIAPSTACPTYGFTPISRQYGIAGNDVTGADFSAAFAGSGTSSLAGRVADASGNGLPGIPVAASGPDNASVVTGGDGAFLVHGLHNGSYTLGPSGTGLRFSPLRRTASLCEQSVGGQDFREVSVWSHYGHLNGWSSVQVIRPLSSGFVAGGDGLRLLRIGPFGEFVWGVALGGPNDKFQAIVEGADDSIVASGTRAATVEWSAEADIVSMTGDGTLKWHRRLGGPGNASGRAAAVSTDNSVLVAGTIASDMFLATIDARGNLLWQKVYGGYVPLAMRADASGTTVAAGAGAAGRLLVLRVDTGGNVVFARGYLGTSSEGVTAAAAWIAPDGAVTFVGRGSVNSKNAFWGMAVQSGGEIGWQRIVALQAGTYEEGVAVLPGADGSMTVVGQSHSPGYDAAVFYRLSAAGDPVWAKVYPVNWPLRRIPRSGAALPDGRMVIAGDATDYGNYWSWIALFDSQGTACADSVSAAWTASTTTLSRDDVPVTASDSALTFTANPTAPIPAGKPPQIECGS